MNSGSTYAFYGSLRKGMGNYLIYQHGLTYLYSIRLKGFKLFSMGPYPCAVETGSPTDSVLAEVFKITDSKIENSIHQMELRVGYYFKDVIVNKNPVGIYLFSSPANYPEVVGGDWVEFFRKRPNS
jgi:gamma-glutamylcyclotransferase (GGCT)/AIG2-like uncharacterized protein YtfP